MRFKFWYFFHCPCRGPGFTGGARCRNAYSLSENVGLYVVNRGIVRSVSQQQVHKCRILSDKKSSDILWEKYLASHYVSFCADIYLLLCAHLILSYFITHCKWRKCDRGAKAGPPYLWLQELHALHTPGTLVQARLFTVEEAYLLASAQVCTHYTVHMHEPSKGNNFKLNAIWS